MKSSLQSLIEEMIDADDEPAPTLNDVETLFNQIFDTPDPNHPKVITVDYTRCEVCGDERWVINKNHV